MTLDRKIRCCRDNSLAVRPLPLLLAFLDLAPSSTVVESAAAASDCPRLRFCRCFSLSMASWYSQMRRSRIAAVCCSSRSRRITVSLLLLWTGISSSPPPPLLLVGSRSLRFRSDNDEDSVRQHRERSSSVDLPFDIDLFSTVLNFSCN